MKILFVLLLILAGCTSSVEIPAELNDTVKDIINDTLQSPTITEPGAYPYYEYKVLTDEPKEFQLKVININSRAEVLITFEPVLEESPLGNELDIELLTENPDTYNAGEERILTYRVTPILHNPTLSGYANDAFNYELVMYANNQEISRTPLNFDLVRPEDSQP